MLIIITLVAAALLFFKEIIFLIQGPPFVPSTDEVTKSIVKEIEKYHPKKILDMGSGDGKLVIALAEAGYTVYSRGN
jgi:hypothetical protein